MQFSTSFIVRQQQKGHIFAGLTNVQPMEGGKPEESFPKILLIIDILQVYCFVIGQMYSCILTPLSSNEIPIGWKLINTY